MAYRKKFRLINLKFGFTIFFSFKSKVTEFRCFLDLKQITKNKNNKVPSTNGLKRHAY